MLRFANWMPARAVVIGRSNIGGKPMAQLLRPRTAPSRSPIAHPRPARAGAQRRNPGGRRGRSGSVPGDWIKPGSVAIDVGINRVPERNPPVIADPPVGHEPQAHGPIQPHPIHPHPGAAPCVPVYTAYNDWLAAMNRRLRFGPPKQTLPQTSGRRMRPISLACGDHTVTPL